MTETAGRCNKCSGIIERKPNQSRQVARRLHRENHSKIVAMPKIEEKKKRRLLW